MADIADFYALLGQSGLLPMPGQQPQQSAQFPAPQLPDDPFARAAMTTQRHNQARAAREYGDTLPVAQLAQDLMMPQTPLDYAMYAAGGPTGKLLGAGVKAGMLGLGAALSPSEAEAGPTSKLLSGGKNLIEHGVDFWQHTQDPAAYARTFITPGDTRASTRFPTAPGSPENPLQRHLSVGLPEMALSPKSFEHNMGLVADYPGFAHLRGMPAREAADAAVEQMRGNLNYVAGLAPPVMRERSPLWYDGANNIANALAERWGVPVQSVAGSMATLSPKRDWFLNATQAERLGDIMFGPAASQRASSEMVSFGREAKSLQDPMLQQMLRRIDGKSLTQLDDPAERALWLRLHDANHNPANYRVITPEGNFGDFVRNNDGTPSKGGLWSASGEQVGKAMQSLMSGGDMNVISPLLGDAHKVRSFNNNISVPNDLRFGDVTADTHQMAAAHMRPMSVKSPEVIHNFGSSLGKKDQPPGYRGPSNSDVYGVSGTYGLVADATRRAAADQGLVPRAGQSLGWETIRELFPDTFKTATSKAAIDDIWRAYDRKELTLDQARKAVVDYAAPGGVGLPSWAQSNAPVLPPTRHSSYR